MKIRYIILLILIAIGAGAYYFTPSLNSIVKGLVNKYGSEVTGTAVNLQGFNFSLTNGTASIDEITVANPKNYKSPYIFDLNKISVKVDLKSLTGNTIVIDSITVNQPIITYEMLSLTQNNIKEIEHNVQNYLNMAAAKKQASDNQVAVKEDSSEGKKIIIKKLLINDAQLVVSTMGKNVSVILPPIQMTNLGENSSSKQTNIPELISKIITEVLNVASQSVVDNNLSNLESVAEENLNAVVGNVKDRVKTLGIFNQ